MVHHRKAIVGHLRHIDEELAAVSPQALPSTKMPDAPPAAAPVQKMKPSPALQIIGKDERHAHGARDWHPDVRMVQMAP